ncbi:hypothetical protein [Citrobacter freundii]|nr:hypothetical protein [Citrobacter freundii]
MLWIDYRAMNISEEQLRHWFVSLAGVEMSWGSDFGDEGLGFFRVNIATPRTILKEAFERIYQSIPYYKGFPEQSTPVFNFCLFINERQGIRLRYYKRSC